MKGRNLFMKEKKNKNDLKLNFILAINILLIVIVIIGMVGGGFVFFKYADEHNLFDEGTKENGVIIASEYEIKSTENISNAYLNNSTKGLTSKEKDILEMAKKVINEVTTKDMTDYEKEYAIYNWMINNISSDTGSMVLIPTSNVDSDNPYGALKNKQAVCVGYATTFRLFMQMLKIDCMVIHTTDLIHSWDLVKLDGEWYHTDTYYGSSFKTTQYFNMNDDYYSTQETWDEEFFPKANGYKYNYSFMNATELKDFYTLPSLVKKAADNKKDGLYLKLESLDKEKDIPVLDTILNGITSAFTDKYSNYSFTYNMIKADNEYILSIYLSKDDESNNASKLSDKQKEKIQDSINKAFDYVYEIDEDYNEEECG